MLDASVSTYDPQLGLELFHAYDAELEVELDLEYAYEPDLEVELEIAPVTPAHVLVRVTPEDIARAAIAKRAAAFVALAPATSVEDGLEDDWFSSFDETSSASEAFDDPSTSPAAEAAPSPRRLRRLSDWLLRRAA